MLVGITGGISTGKTTAAQVIARSGVRIVDCDEISHYLTAYNTVVLTAIREHFGPQVFYPLGALNRSALAGIVFSREDERRTLERILHPAIKAVVSANIEDAAASERHLVVVAPLMIEAGMAGDMDRLWVITCNADHQLARLCARTGASPEDAQRWIAAQMPLSEKEKYADTVIRNDGTIEDFKAAVDREWQAVLAD
jgi:dephospho-CoA kinase